MLQLGTRLLASYSPTPRPRASGVADDYEILTLLGKGSSARVFMGVEVLSGQKVVVKCFKQMPEEAVRKEIGLNLKLLSGLSAQVEHAEFIHLLDTIYDPSSASYSLIYEYHPGVPLNQLIQTVSLRDALRHTAVLARTLRYLHGLKVVHRDIKPANVLVTSAGPKLFDLGLAKEVEGIEELRTNNFGTKCYKTPEVVYRMDSYSQKVDVWGLGLILAEMVLNKRHLLPYHSDAAMLSQLASLCQLRPDDYPLIKQELLEHIRVDKHKSFEGLARQKGLEPEVIDLVTGMLRINPNSRLEIEQVIGHPALRGVEL